MKTPSAEKTVHFIYSNWRGEVSARVAVPERIWYGPTEYHQEEQWMMTAFDVDKNQYRDFALSDCDFRMPSTSPDLPHLCAILDSKPESGSPHVELRREDLRRLREEVTHALNGAAKVFLYSASVVDAAHKAVVNSKRNRGVPFSVPLMIVAVITLIILRGMS